jgi:hypothetical protein
MWYICPTLAGDDINITIAIPDIIHRPMFYLKHDVEPTRMGQAELVPVSLSLSTGLLKRLLSSV